MFIAIDGPIGVGKTTLAKKLSRNLPARAVLERVKGDLLKDFYSHKPGADITTQYYFLYHRFRQLLEVRDLLNGDHLVVCDYSFEKNLIFSLLTLARKDMDVFRQYYELLRAEIPTPDVTVYLQGSLSTLQQRIRGRGRNYEKKIKPGYLEKVVEAYQNHFFSHPPDRLLVVNTDHINVADVWKDVEDLRGVILGTPYGVNYYHPPGSGSDPEG